MKDVMHRTITFLVLLPLCLACTGAAPHAPARQGQAEAPALDTAGPAVLVPGSVRPTDMHGQDDSPRVREARRRQDAAIVEMFTRAGMKYPPEAIFIRVFKNEKELELWARSSTDETFHLVKTYPVCALSGGVGPKRAEGDGQVPEGVYRIARYNPVSRYHLSLGLNYPNDSDRMLGGRNPGSDIFIHGDCVTIGCIPITDALIEELYIVALDAHARQPRVPVHVFPLRMDEKGMSALRKYADAYDPTLWPFWENLQAVYRAFEESHRLPDVRIDGAGRYLIGPP